MLSCANDSRSVTSSGCIAVKTSKKTECWRDESDEFEKNWMDSISVVDLEFTQFLKLMKDPRVFVTCQKYGTLRKREV